MGRQLADSRARMPNFKTAQKSLLLAKLVSMLLPTLLPMFIGLSATTMISSFAFAQAVTCDDLFQTVSGREAEPFQNEIALLKARFIKIPNEKADAVVDRLTRAIYMSTMALARIHSLAYPFSYISEGTILRVRSWAKTGNKEHLEEIEKWLKRYKTYPMDRRLLVERTMFVRNEAKIIEEAIAKNEFPIDLTIPKLIRDGLMKETVSFQTRREAQDELRQLKSAEYLRFDSGPGRNYSRGKFMLGRDFEQAHLEIRLKLLLIELKKLPLAGRDPELRSKMIAETKELLNTRELKATPEGRYVEARRALTDEIRYFAGKREMTDVANDLVEGGLFQNDLYDLGVDRERLGPISRFMRGLVVQAPKLIIGLSMLSVAPTLKYDVKLVIARDSLMHEISELPQRDFEAQSFKYLKTIYGTHDGVLNAEARAGIARFRTLREEHANELREERISQAEYMSALTSESTASQISAEDFKSLMELPAEKFEGAAETYVNRHAQSGTREEMLAHLKTAYASVTAPDAVKGEERHLTTDQLLSSLMGFFIGGGGAGEGGE